MKKYVTGIIILVLICAGIVLCFFPDKLPDSIRPVSRLVESFHRKVSDWLNPQPKQPEFLYDVIRAVDGDTLLILINGEEISVRLIGIDAPESVHSDISRNTEEGRFASKRMKE